MEHEEASEKMSDRVNVTWSLHLFLIGGHVTAIPILCGISSALLQYFTLASFGWTAVEAVWLYLKLVKVFRTIKFFHIKIHSQVGPSYINKFLLVY